MTQSAAIAALCEAAIVDVNAALDDVMRERPFKDRREAAKHLLAKGFDDWNAREFQRDAYLRAIKKRFRTIIAESTRGDVLPSAERSHRRSPMRLP